MNKKVVLGKGIYFMISERGEITSEIPYKMISNDIHIGGFRVNLPILMVKLFDDKYDQHNPNQFMSRVSVVDTDSEYPYRLENLKYRIVNFDKENFRRYKNTSLWVDRKGNVVNLGKKTAITPTWYNDQEQWYMGRYILKVMMANCFVPNENNYKYVWCPQSPTQKPDINLMKWCTKDEYAFYKKEYNNRKNTKNIKEDIIIKKDIVGKIYSQRELREYIIENDKSINNKNNLYIGKINIYKSESSDLSLDKLIYRKAIYDNFDNLIHILSYGGTLYLDPENRNIIDTKDNSLYNLKDYEIYTIFDGIHLDKKILLNHLDLDNFDISKSRYDGCCTNITSRSYVLYREDAEEGLKITSPILNTTQKRENVIHRMCCIDWIMKNDESIPKDKDIYFSPIKKIDENKPWIFSNMSYSWREKPSNVKKLGGLYKIDSEGYVYLESNRMVKKLPDGTKSVKLNNRVYKVPSFKNECYKPSLDDKNWKPYYENKEIICYVSKDGKVRNIVGEEIPLSKKNDRNDYIKISSTNYIPLSTLMSCWHPFYDKYSYIPSTNNFIEEGIYTFENLSIKYIFSPSKRQDDNKIKVPVEVGNNTWYYFRSNNIFVSIDKKGRRTVLSNLDVYNFLGPESYYSFINKNKSLIDKLFS